MTRCAELERERGNGWGDRVREMDARPDQRKPNRTFAHAEVPHISEDQIGVIRQLNFIVVGGCA
jgi:hypothetical protein